MNGVEISDKRIREIVGKKIGAKVKKAEVRRLKINGNGENFPLCAGEKLAIGAVIGKARILEKKESNAVSPNIIGVVTGETRWLDSGSKINELMEKEPVLLIICYDQRPEIPDIKCFERANS